MSVATLMNSNMFCFPRVRDLKVGLIYIYFLTILIILAGAQLLAEQHHKLPEGEHYVRCAEKHTLEDSTIFYLVICMLRSMSVLLVHSKRLSLDTAFRRLSGKWQEFEMETWELDRMKCKSI